MNFNILYELRFNNIFSHILSFLFIIYILRDSPIPSNITLDSNIKKYYFFVSILFISSFIFIFFSGINLVIFLFIIIEIVNKIIKQDKYKKELLKREEKKEKEQNEKIEKDKIVNFDENKNEVKYYITENENKTLEEDLVDNSYIMSNRKSLSNPTPKYQAILPEINCDYLY